jgi:hypothetical protein
MFPQHPNRRLNILNLPQLRGQLALRKRRARVHATGELLQHDAVVVCRTAFARQRGKV